MNIFYFVAKLINGLLKSEFLADLSKFILVKIFHRYQSFYPLNSVRISGNQTSFLPLPTKDGTASAVPSIAGFLRNSLAEASIY